MRPLSNLACSSGGGCYWCHHCCASWSVERPSSPHESLLWPQERGRGVRGRQPSTQSQHQTRLLPNGTNAQTPPSHLWVPFVQHGLVCPGWGVTKTRGFIPSSVQVRSWTTDYCVMCKSIPLSGPHVLGPEDSNLLQLLSLTGHTWEYVVGNIPLSPWAP